MNKKLYRDEYHKVLGGVCSGLAEYFEMDVTIVRLLFAFTVIIMGVGIVPYIVLWVVLPKKGYIYNNFNKNNPIVDYTVPQEPGDPIGTQSSTQPVNPFGGYTYNDNPYSAPNGFKAPKQRSTGGLIVGLVLIIIGAAILIDNYDLIPDFDFERLWPVVLVFVGAALILAGQKKQPWNKQDWQDSSKNENPEDGTPSTDNSTIIEPDKI